jgi:hypothetical protein
MELEKFNQMESESSKVLRCFQDLRNIAVGGNMEGYVSVFGLGFRVWWNLYTSNTGKP